MKLCNFSGPGKSPEQWHHQEQHEMGGGGGGHHMGGGEDDEQLNNYDTGAGFFQVCRQTLFCFLIARISQVPLHKYAALARLIND